MVVLRVESLRFPRPDVFKVRCRLSRLESVVFGIFGAGVVIGVLGLRVQYCPPQ